MADRHNCVFYIHKPTFYSGLVGLGVEGVESSQIKTADRQDLPV